MFNVHTAFNWVHRKNLTQKFMLKLILIKNLHLNIDIKVTETFYLCFANFCPDFCTHDSSFIFLSLKIVGSEISHRSI